MVRSKFSDTWGFLHNPMCQIASQKDSPQSGGKYVPYSTPYSTQKIQLGLRAYVAQIEYPIELVMEMMIAGFLDGVLCTTPQKGIVHNKTNESYFKKLLGLCLRLQQTLHSRETSRNVISSVSAFQKV